MLKNILEVFEEPCSSYSSKCKIKKKGILNIKLKIHLPCCEDYIFSAVRICLNFTQLPFLILSCLTPDCCEGLDNTQDTTMQFYLGSTAARSWVCYLFWKGNQYTSFFPPDLLSIGLLTDWAHRASSASACLQGHRKVEGIKSFPPWHTGQTDLQPRCSGEHKHSMLITLLGSQGGPRSECSDTGMMDQPL